MRMTMVRPHPRAPYPRLDQWQIIRMTGGEHRTGRRAGRDSAVRCREARRRAAWPRAGGRWFALGLAPARPAGHGCPKGQPAVRGIMPCSPTVEDHLGDVPKADGIGTWL